MKVNRKLLSLLSLFILLCAAGPAAFAAEETTPQEASAVYFTKDTSEKALKKLYKKALASRPGKTAFKQYRPDDYYWADEMQEGDAAAGTEPVYAAWLSVLQDKGAEPLFSWLPLPGKEPAVWHDFPYSDCMCYAPDRFLSSKETGRCQQLPWYPSDQCRRIVGMLTRYEELVSEPETLVVLSYVSARKDGKIVRGGALQNMMADTNPYSTPDGEKFSPLVEIWAARLTAVDKNTLCVNIIAKAGADGKEKAFGTVASADCTMADKAAWDILQQADPSVNTASVSRRLALWNALVRNKVPEEIYDYYGGKDEEKNIRRVQKFFADRAAKHYRLITLD